MIEELGPEETLGHRPLMPVGSRDTDPSAGTPIAGVRCGRPLIYPVEPSDLPGPWAARARAGDRRYFGLLLAFDLDPLPAGRRYRAARFGVTLTGPDVIAVRLDDADSLGITYEGEPAAPIAVRTLAAVRSRPGWLRRLTGRAGVPRAWTTGVQSASFGWVHDDPVGELLVPRNHGMHALIETPSAVRSVRGTITVEAEVSSGRGRQLGEIRQDLAFTADQPGSAPPSGAAVRLCMAADVAGYSRRSNAETERIQAVLVELLSRARRAAGVTDDDVEPQPQGDGQFTVLPVGLDEAAVIPRLLDELGRALHDANTGMPADRRIRLRVAFHRGLIKAGRNGWVGTAPIAVHRILDSPPLRQALIDDDRAAYVTGFPDVLYRDVLVHGDGPPAPDDLRPVTVDLPGKDFLEQCWLYAGPGVPA